MGDQPLRVDGITRKTPTQLVVDATGRHAITGMQHHLNGLRVLKPLGVTQQKLRLARLWEFRRTAEAAMARIVSFLENFAGLAQNLRIQRGLGELAIR